MDIEAWNLIGGHMHGAITMPIWKKSYVAM